MFSPIFLIPQRVDFISSLQDSYVSHRGRILPGTFPIPVLHSVLQPTVPLRIVTTSGVKGLMWLVMPSDRKLPEGRNPVFSTAVLPNPRHDLAHRWCSKHSG